MNPWWIVMSLLACGWLVPMIGARAAGLPWWFFVSVGAFWCLVCAAAGPLYEWGIRARRKLGMKRPADLGERMRPRLLPPARLALLITAAISFVMAAV